MKEAYLANFSKAALSPLAMASNSSAAAASSHSTDEPAEVVALGFAMGTVRDNPRLAAGAFAMIALFALIVIVPPFAHIFGMVSISPYHWLISIGLSLVPTLTAEIGKLIQSGVETRRNRRRLVRHIGMD